MLQAERNATERLERLTGHIEALVPEWDLAPVVNALQALRGVALISAVCKCWIKFPQKCWRKIPHFTGSAISR
jgi:hypothetical protein